MICQSEWRLLISVVRRGRGDRVVEITRKAGAGGNSVFFGRGTAQNRILRVLGLADTQKELVFTIAQKDAMPPIVEALKNAPDLCKKIPGIGIILNVTQFMRSGSFIMTNAPLSHPANNEIVTNCREEKMACDYHRQLICVIVNAGYADDIMLAARKAGATGGTIIRGRGTGTPEDSGFFGITIVPEKELLMILTLNETVEPILHSIKNCPCLAETGVGIVFCMPAESFFPLGQSRQQK